MLERFYNQLKISQNSLRVSEILLGIVLLVNYFDYFCIQDEFFNSRAYLHASTVLQVFPQPHWLPPVFEFSESVYFVNVLLLIGIALALCAALGFFSRYALAGTFVLLNVFYERYPVIFGPSDLTLRLTVLWMFILQGASSWQENTDITGRTLKRRSLTKFLFWHLQIILAYFIAAIEKLKFPEWSTYFNALEIVSKLDRYMPSFGLFFFNVWPVSALRVITVAVIFLEGIVIFLILGPNKKLKNLTIALFCIFHIIVFFTMNVHFISVLFLIWWVTLIPDEFWKKLHIEFLTKILATEKQHSSPGHSNSLLDIAFAYFCFLVIFSSFVGKMSPLVPRLKSFSYLARNLHLSQDWTMFSNPNDEQKNFFVIPMATFEDGSVIDPFSMRPPNFTFNPIFSRTERSMHFLNFHKMLMKEKNIAQNFSKRFFCERWREMKPDNKILSYSLYVVGQRKTGEKFQELLFDGKCKH